MPIEKRTEFKSFDVVGAQAQNAKLILFVGGAGVLVTLLAFRSSVVFGIVMGLTFAIMLPIIYAVRNSNLRKIQLADKEMQTRGARSEIVAYEGDCPYCATKIKLRSSSSGENCPACLHRIILRNENFHSVATPVVRGTGQ